MRRFFVQNIFFLILVNLVVKPIWIFGIDRNVQNAVGHESYGLYQALFSLSLIFQTLLDFGLQSYNTRTVAQSPLAMRKLFPNIIAAKAALSFLYLAVVMVTGLLMGYSTATLGMLFLLCLVQVLSSFILYLRSNVAAMHRFKTDSMLSVSDRFFMIAICSALLFYQPLAKSFRIEWFVAAQIAASGITAVAAFFICTRLARFDWQHFDFKKILVICKKSLPYATLIFLMAIYMRSDAFLLERMLKDTRPAEAGVYAASFRLLDVVNNVTGVLFAGILLPLFGRLLARREDVKPIIGVSINLLVPVGITTAITACFFGSEIMMPLYKDASAYDGRVLGLLMLSYPAFCLSYVYATLLTANGSLRVLIAISAGAVVLSLVANLLLIPRCGAEGAAITGTVVQWMVAICNIVAAKKIIQLPAGYKTLLRFTGFIVFTALMGFLIASLPAGTLVHLGLMALTGLAGMVICGLVSVKTIQRLMATFKG